MVGIKVIVETEKKDHEMKMDSGSSAVLLTKMPFKLNSFINKIEKLGEKVLNTEVIFIGGWNYLILQRFARGLDKRGVSWKWEL